MKQLIQLISELKAPKGQYNLFGKYKYRSCEDILEAVKPLLAKYELLLTITDDVVAVGDRVYIKATATVVNAEGECVSSSSLAREENEKKGMDASQITGSASSYARKYALNGLFCIDDTKDADATNTHGKDEQKEQPKTTATYDMAIKALQIANTAELVAEVGKIWPPRLGDKGEAFRQMCGEKYKSLLNKAS